MKTQDNFLETVAVSTSSQVQVACYKVFYLGMAASASGKIELTSTRQSFQIPPHGQSGE